MSKPLGFVLLVNPYNALAQTERLIAKLNSMFDFPPIACHHDFSKRPDFIPNVPNNVLMVAPHVVTEWADFSCIEAAVKALRLLYAGDSSPAWFVYLSGSDFPIKPAAHILAELEASPFDAYIEHVPVQRNSSANAPEEFRRESHKGADWPRICHWRYCSVPITLPWITRRWQPRMRTFQIEHPLVTSLLLPFTKKFRCFAGEAWFCGNRRAAEAIIKSYSEDTRLVDHYRGVLCPEESYFHTVLANSPGLRLSQNTLRYTDWTVKGNHPKLLAMEDRSRLLNSNAHFARKFPESLAPEMARLLEELTSAHRAESA
jgi:hypothetical protein